MAKPRTPKRKTTIVRAPQRPVLALAVAGMLLTGYLSALAWFGEGAMLCGPGSSCDLIQQSRWSKVLGLPLAFWGFLFYGLIAGLALQGTQRMKEWRRLWTLSLIALAISVYLTIMGIWQLKAVCLWCLTSLGLLAAIFAVLTLQRPAQTPGIPWSNWWLNRGVLAIIAVGALHFYYDYDRLLSRPADAQLSALAEHLTDTGARYYGAFWCSACQQQNALFGTAKAQLPYTECTPNGRHGAVALECVRADVQSFPTWIINGERHLGVLEPKDLARYSGFAWED